MGVTFKHQGSFKNLERFLKNYDVGRLTPILEHYGQMGVDALADATPTDSGITAHLWGFEAGTDDGGLFVQWYNSSIVPGGIPIVVLLIYGHATRNGGYVEGRDFITPVIQPIMDQLVDALWQEVKGK